MKKRQIFKFQNAVVYPFAGEYEVRLGRKWGWAESIDYPNHYQLVKQCRVNRYRYPFVQFCKDDFELVIIDGNAGTKEQLEKTLGVKIYRITKH